MSNNTDAWGCPISSYTVRYEGEFCGVPVFEVEHFHTKGEAYRRFIELFNAETFATVHAPDRTLVWDTEDEIKRRCY